MAVVMSALSEDEAVVKTDDKGCRPAEKVFKPSQYNFIIPDNRCGWDALLFNGLRSSLIRLPHLLHLATSDILSRSRIVPSALPTEFQPFLAVLTEGGFIIEDTIDELDVIKGRFHNDKETGPLHLVVTPTLNCNLACTYCYQVHPPGTMTRDVCGRIVELARQKLKGGNITELNVDWYGGEPLLVPQVISYLSGHLQNLARESDCRYEASIATNGTLLDERVFHLLVEGGVKTCQVTIDGPKEVHDKRRGYRQGRGSSFDRVLENMRRLVGRMELSVRINVDEDNIGHAYTLLDIFREEGFFQHSETGFFPYMAMTGPINPCIPFNCRPVSMGEFYKKNLKFQEKVFEYSGRGWLRPVLDFPFAVGAPCGALMKNTYAFDPKGQYFRCALEIGEANKQCGHVCGEVNSPQYKKWGDYDPLTDRECLECRYLPFCMGGCPKVIFDKNGFYRKEGCVYWKGNLEDIVRLYAKAMGEVKTHGKDKG